MSGPQSTPRCCCSYRNCGILSRVKKANTRATPKRDETEKHLHVKMPAWMRDELEAAAAEDPTMRTSSNVIRTLVVQYLRGLDRA